MKAEVSQMMERGGHWYLELIQKEEGPFGAASIVAKCRAVIWRSHADILKVFEKETGKRLVAGMTAVFHARVSFKALYGFSLDIDALDTDFMLGQREKERRETLSYLSKAGLLQKQSKLALPYLPARIGIVSSDSAAGYGDFLKHIKDNRQGFVFPLELFPAVMQGEAAPESIVGALRLAVSSGVDVIFILRGGGADSDMFCFDDRQLCEAICRCPVPVFSAVGHEKDRHICDEVAAVSLKTPTALAERLICWYGDVEEEVKVLQAAIVRGLRDGCRICEATVLAGTRCVVDAAEWRVSALENSAVAAFGGVRKALLMKQVNMEQQVVRLKHSVVASLVNRIRRLNDAVVEKVGTTTFAVRMLLKGEEAEADKRASLIVAADPRRILSQGYVLAVDSKGDILKGAAALKEGDTFILRHLDGRWDCSVDAVKMDK